MGREKRGARVLGPYRHGLRWRIRVIDCDGSVYMGSYPSEREAAKAARELRATAPTRRTVGQALREYEQHQRRKGNKPKSIETTIYRLGEWLDEYQALGDVTPRMIGQAYQRRVDACAVSTHRSELSEVKTFFRWAVSSGYLRRSPAEEVKPVGVRHVGKPQLTRSEARSLYQLALGVGEVGLAVALALSTGLRSGEILALTKRDIDTVGESTWIWVVRGKTAAAKRQLEIPTELAEKLCMWTASLAAEDRVFARSASWLRRGLAGLCRAAGTPVVPPHGLRGTWASLAMAAGSESLAVSRSLGHTEWATTERHYAKAEAIDAGRSKTVLQVLSGGIDSQEYRSQAKKTAHGSP